jgi:ABC-type sugar transport system permease subunit
LKRAEQLSAYLFLSLPLLVFAFVLAYPIIENLYLSFTSWAGPGATSPIRLVGTRNYVDVLTTSVTSIMNTLTWVVFQVVVPVFLGLFIAIIVRGKKGETIFKTIFFAPFALSGVIVGLMWMIMYDPTSGAINTVLRELALGNFAIAWLGTPTVNTYMMNVAYAWSQIGFPVVIFSAGLGAISKDITDAAKVDGASGWSLFRNVTFPLLSPFTVVVLAVTIINALKIFDVVYIMTAGGPFRSSETLAFSVYYEAFTIRSYSRGAAMATILFLVVTVVSVAYLRYMFRREIKY